MEYRKALVTWTSFVLRVADRIAVARQRWDMESELLGTLHWKLTLKGAMLKVVLGVIDFANR